MRNVIAILLVLLFTVPAWAIEVEAPRRINLSSNEETANADSSAQAIPINGRFVVFASEADNLVDGDTNQASDVFLRNLQTGETTRLSVVGEDEFQDENDQEPGRQPGAEGDAVSGNPAVSPVDPRGNVMVAFESSASNFLHDRSADTGGHQHIYIHIVSEGLTELVDFRKDPESRGVIVANGDSMSPTITTTPERMRVAYASDATNIVDFDNNGQRDIYVLSFINPEEKKKRTDEENPESDLARVKILNITGLADGPSNHPRLSGDGRYVIYESSATNLVNGIETSGQQIFIHDFKEATTRLISKSSTGEPGDGDSHVGGISYKGRHIVYLTEANNILENSEAEGSHIVLHDLETGENIRVNQTVDGEAGNGIAEEGLSVSISANGRFVVFADNSSNLVEGDDNELIDVYVKDMKTDEIALVSKNSAGEPGNSESLNPLVAGAKFNANTGIVTYLSSATNLVDDNNQGHLDLFLNRLSVSPPPLTSETEIEVPPDVEVISRTRKMTIEMEEFELEDAESLAGQGTQARRTRIRYRVTVRRQNTNWRDRGNSRRGSRRNTVTFRRQPVGKYNVRYRVLTKVGKTTSSTTNNSPRISVNITRR